MYEIVTHDGKVYQIANTDKNKLARLAQALELIPVTLTNGKIHYFSKGTVARMQESETRVLERKHKPLEELNLDGDNREAPGPGYAKFQEMKANMLKN